jgi:hypothetical protein
MCRGGGTRDDLMEEMRFEGHADRSETDVEPSGHVREDIGSQKARSSANDVKSGVPG